MRSNSARSIGGSQAIVGARNSACSPDYFGMRHDHASQLTTLGREASISYEAMK
jgi:hypothetical protein